MKNVTTVVKDLNLKNIKPHTIVSLILMIISYINVALLNTGKPIIDVGSDEINLYVGIAYMIVTTLYGWYKNQSITKAAQAGDDVLYYLRDGKLTIDELQKLIQTHVNSDVIDDVEKDLKSR